MEKSPSTLGEVLEHNILGVNVVGLKRSNGNYEINPGPSNIVLSLIGLITPIVSLAQTGSIDRKIDQYMGPVTKIIEDIIFFTVPVGFGYEVPFVLIWLLVGAVFFTIYFNFISISGFKHAIDVVRGKFDNPKHNEQGEVSHFQALTAALSGTVGVGNIAGVAIAVSIGGPGATFWMIVAGLLGMSAKFIECTLGTKYRIENPDGSVSGGPAYYLSRGLAKKGKSFGHLGKFLAIMFSIACIGGSLGGGNMVQINQATKQLIHCDWRC